MYHVLGRSRRGPYLALLFACVAYSHAAGAEDEAPPANSEHRFIYLDEDKNLQFPPDEQGNEVPDYSFAGYHAGGVALPTLPVKVVVPIGAGDATARIQAAIDYVASLKRDENGHRGAVLLAKGTHEVAGTLLVRASGVVLRGEANNDEPTKILATGSERRAVIRFLGEPIPAPGDKTYEIATAYVPVGARRLTLAARGKLAVGDTIDVERLSSKEWISALGMNRFPSRDKGSWLDWQPNSLNGHSERVITAVHGNAITLDAPLTDALNSKLGGGQVRYLRWPGRIEEVGIENLTIESTFNPANPKDEEHAWDGVSIENAVNCWVRQVVTRHLAGSAVRILERCRKITVVDCDAQEPVAEIGAQRRQIFFTAGQQCLFLRCTSAEGWHDFALGYLAAGPNAFVECKANSAHSFSGPIESWVTGALFDNVVIDGAALALTNRESDRHGVGWAAANCMLWQSTAAQIICRSPPTAHNWSLGCFGEFYGDGQWRSLTQGINPKSIYFAQLSERLGHDASGVPKECDFAKIEVPKDTPSIDAILSKSENQPKATATPVAKPIRIEHGWLVCEDRLLAGTRGRTVWWGGVSLPDRAGEKGPAITRFVPGRIGPKYTDDPHEFVSGMVETRQAMVDHHWGLWYERRRDDHTIQRRLNGDVWAPFYEQPWARSGQGTAFDGLSKYDLSKFNLWYFDRLARVAGECDLQGRILHQQMYFQHNLLESSAHWADFPWRPANCLQQTGFPEPPPHGNTSQTHMAEMFYDLDDPIRRELHENYIRHCLDVLGEHPNVIFSTGEEFNGPLHFMKFWLQTVIDWKKKTGKEVTLSLCCTKDVQDEILADEDLAKHISVIDIKYWWYTSNGKLYNPPGGESVAPRKQVTQWTGGTRRSDAQTARQIREYRVRFPDKAIWSHGDSTPGVLMIAAGGSLPSGKDALDKRLLKAAIKMQPTSLKALNDHVENENLYVLANEDQSQFLIASPDGEIHCRLPEGDYSYRQLDIKTGKRRKSRTDCDGEINFTDDGPAAIWVEKE
jgi:hypothetical protein